MPVAAAVVFDNDIEEPPDDLGDPFLEAFEASLCLGEDDDDDDDEDDDEDDDDGEAGAAAAPAPLRVELSSSSSISTGSTSGHPDRSLPSK